MYALITAMNKQAVLGILRKIFSFYGYEVTSSDVGDLLAEKDSEHLFIKYDPYVNINSVKHFSNSVQRYGGKCILISDSFDDRIMTYAHEMGLAIWDRKELESKIGKAVLSGALEGMNERIELKKEKEPIQAEQSKKEYEKTIRIFLRSVPVHIGKSDVSAIAESKVGREKYKLLKFIPVWYYKYSFNAPKKFKSRIIDLKGEGEGYVDALTGENSFEKYRDVKDNTFVPTQNYEIKEPYIEKKDAIIKAANAIIREHTKEVRLNEMIGDTIVFEQKVFSPELQDLNLEMDLIHIPVWEIRGQNETVEVNGYNGHILGVRVYNDAEFV
jgi:hypothetical protein